MPANLLARTARRLRREGPQAVVHAVIRRVYRIGQRDHSTEPLGGVFAWLAAQRSFVIVQIGAFTGATGNDPLYAFLQRELPKKPHARALLIEPVESSFAGLAEAYAGIQNVSFENVAIADADGEQDFYRLGVDPTAHGKPAWLSQVASLRADRMDLWEDFRPDLRDFWLRHHVVERVRCATLSVVLERNNIAHIDLLQIDAEGNDYEILKTIDFAQLRPRFINYERELLGEDEGACRSMMTAAGYLLLESGKWGEDTLCVAIDQTSRKLRVTLCGEITEQSEPSARGRDLR